MDERLRKLERDALSDPMARFRLQAERFRVDPNAETYAGFLDALAHRQDIELLDLDLDYTEDPRVIATLEEHSHKLTFCGWEIRDIIYNLYGLQRAIYVLHHPQVGDGYVAQPYLDEFVIERLGIYVGSHNSAEFMCLVNRRDQPTDLGFSVYHGELECKDGRPEILNVDIMIASIVVAGAGEASVGPLFGSGMPASGFFSWEHFDVPGAELDPTLAGEDISCRYGNWQIAGTDENAQIIEDAQQWFINDLWDNHNDFQNLITVFS